MIDGVHRSDNGEQHLRSTDIGGRLVSADVLFAGLKRQAIGGSAVRIDRYADQPTGQMTFEALGDRDESGVRASIEERYTEALGGAHDDIGTQQSGASRRVSASRSEPTMAKAPRSWAAAITSRGSRIAP